MTNIDIQRKEGPGIWPWLIGALALVLVIWAVVEFTGTGTDRGTATPAAEQAPAETYPPVTPTDPYAPDPYAPPAPGTDPATTPGADPAAPPPATDPNIDRTEIQQETPGMTRDQPPATGAGTAGQPRRS
jgi:hypothetical protein